MRGFQIEKTIYKKSLLGAVKIKRVEPTVYSSKEEVRRIVMERNLIQMPFNIRKNRDSVHYSVIPAKRKEYIL